MVYKIVITGGPCGGKTTAIQRIIEEFSEKGYNVVVVPDAATLLINSGVSPSVGNKNELYNFQKCVTSVQLGLDKIIYDSFDKDDETILICGSGIIDGKAYVNDEDFYNILLENNLNLLDVLMSYDMVLHLKTFAIGKENFYDYFNSILGADSEEEARVKDQKILENWAGHGRHKIINNDGSFDNKMNKVTKYIYGLIKKPLPIKKQFKYLVDSVDLDDLYNLDLVKQNIEQFFLDNNNLNINYKRIANGDDVIYKVIVTSEIDGEEITTERGITCDEYLENMPNDCKTLSNARFSFEYNNQYFNLDVFRDFTLLKVNCTSKNDTVKLPPFVHVVDDITKDVNYDSCNLYYNSNIKGKILKK